MGDEQRQEREGTAPRKKHKFDWGWRTVLIAAGLFWVLCSIFALQRFYNFFPTFVSFDQGIFNQVFWNSLHGRWFEGSLSASESSAVQLDNQLPEVFYRRLAQHFTPALLLWLPIYALFQSPAGLSLLQVTLMTAGGLVLYALARHYHPPHVSALIAVSYFCANAVIAPTLANFHDFSQIPLFVFGLLWALEKRRLWLFALLLGLTLVVREDAGVITFGVGFYMAASRRFVWAGVAVCILSLGYMLLLTNLVMPLFAPDISRRFMVEQFGQFTNGQEASTLEVLWAIIRNPDKVLATVVNPPGRTLSYVLAQWLPLAFVPVISLDAWLLTGFPLLKLLLQQDPTALSMHLRYAVSLVPGLFYGAILWWHQHPNWFRPRLRQFWLFCLGLALLFTVTSNPNRALSIFIPDSIQPWVYTSPARQWEHAQAVRSLLRQIPADASVTATGNIVAHLSSRREVLRYPGTRLINDNRQQIGVEYAVLDFWYPLRFSPAFPDEARSFFGMTNRVLGWLRDGSFGLMDFQDGVALLRRGVPSSREAAAAWNQFHQPLD